LFESIKVTKNVLNLSEVAICNKKGARKPLLMIDTSRTTAKSCCAYENKPPIRPVSKSWMFLRGSLKWAAK